MVGDLKGEEGEGGSLEACFDSGLRLVSSAIALKRVHHLNSET